MVFGCSSGCATLSRMNGWAINLTNNRRCSDGRATNVNMHKHMVCAQMHKGYNAYSHRSNKIAIAIKL